MTNTFYHLDWEIQPFHLYSGRISMGPASSYYICNLGVAVVTSCLIQCEVILLMKKFTHYSLVQFVYLKNSNE